MHKKFHNLKKENYNRTVFDEKLYEKNGCDKISVMSVETHGFTAQLMRKCVGFHKKV